MKKRAEPMSLKVPYLADAGIEASANALLADCARRTKIDVRPPVPVEEILEDHLQTRTSTSPRPGRAGQALRRIAYLPQAMAGSDCRRNPRRADQQHVLASPPRRYPGRRRETWHEKGNGQRVGRPTG